MAFFHLCTNGQLLYLSHSPQLIPSNRWPNSPLSESTRYSVVQSADEIIDTSQIPGLKRKAQLTSLVFSISIQNCPKINTHEISPLRSQWTPYNWRTHVFSARMMFGRWTTGFSPFAVAIPPHRRILALDLWHLRWNENKTRKKNMNCLGLQELYLLFIRIHLQLSGLKSFESNTFIFGSGILISAFWIPAKNSRWKQTILL